MRISKQRSRAGDWHQSPVTMIPAPLSRKKISWLSRCRWIPIPHLGFRKEKAPMRTKVPTKLVVRQSSDPAILTADEEREIDVR